MEIIKLIFCIALGILISSCEDILVKTRVSDQNMEDFEAAWHRVKAVYPFLDYKRINWDSVYSVYHQRVETANGDEFYVVFELSS